MIITLKKEYIEIFWGHFVFMLKCKMFISILSKGKYS